MNVLCAALALVGAQGLSPGQTVEPFAVREESGAVYEWKPGRTTILTFWAYWCDTWKTQTQRLSAAGKALEGMPVDMLSISVDGRWSELGQDAAWGKLLNDPGGKWSRGIGIDRVPYTFVVDPAGRVRWTQSGVIRSDDLIKAVTDALAEPVSGQVFLTFDDFPARDRNEELLDILRREGVTATFFSVGQRIGSHAELFRRVAREGHSVQLHSWSHDAKQPELDRCQLALRETLGIQATLYRPPGSNEVRGIGDGKALQVSVIDPYDYLRPGKTELLRRVLSPLRAGAVIQLHVGVGDTETALPEIVKAVKARGLSFGVLR